MNTQELIAKIKKKDGVVERSILKALGKNGLPYFTKMKHGIIYAVVGIDRETAMAMLERNIKNNRVKNKAQIKYLAHEAEAGEFLITGDTIKFDENGRMIDGQHRLQSVVTSGVTIYALVVYGLKPEAVYVVDTGLQRKGKDILGMEGFADNATGMSTALTILKNFTEGTVNKVRPKEMKVAVKKFLGIGDSLAMMEKLNGDRKYGIGLTPHMAVWHYMASQKYGKTEVSRFAEQFYTGVNVEADSPVRALRDVMNSTNRKAMNNLEKAKSIITAWNAQTQKEHVTAHNLDMARKVMRNGKNINLASTVKAEII